MNDIFGSPAVVRTSLPSGFNRAYSTLTIGDTLVDFPMIDVSEGKQGARIQIDAALDGSIYAVGTTKGLGTYSMVFLDGGISECKEGKQTATTEADMAKNSIIKKYNELKTLNARKATVKIFGATNSKSSKALTSFSGIITNMSINLVEVGGIPYLRVGLAMVGSWEDE